MEVNTDPHTWSAAQVAEYLRSVHLPEHYVQVFESEDINGMVLLSLTKEELKGEPFNIKGFGPIKTVTATIASLKEQRARHAAAAEAPAPAAPAEAPAPAPAPADGGPSPSGMPSPGDDHLAATFASQLAPSFYPPPQHYHPGPPPPQQQPFGDPLQGMYPMPFAPAPGAAPVSGGGGGGGGGGSGPPSVAHAGPEALETGYTWPRCPPPPVFPEGFSSEALRRQLNAAHAAIDPVDDDGGGGGSGGGGGAAEHHFVPEYVGFHGGGSYYNPRHAEPAPAPPAVAAAAPTGGGGGGGVRHRAHSLTESVGPSLVLERRPAAAARSPPRTPPTLSPKSSGISPSVSPLPELKNQLQLVLAGKLGGREDDDILYDGEESAPKRASPIAEFRIDLDQGLAKPSKATQKTRSVTVVEPVGEMHADLNYTEVENNTDLREPPSNWLNEDTRVNKVHNPGVVVHPSREFMTSELGMSVPEVDTIDVIAPAANLKDLFATPYTTKDVSLSVHKVGNSLVIEDMNTASVATRPDLMMSKLLYYSILAEDHKRNGQGAAGASSPPPSDRSEGSESQANSPGSEPIEVGGGEGGARPAAAADDSALPSSPTTKRKVALPHSEIEAPRGFYRNMKWHFQDLNLLLGSDQLVMQRGDTGEVSLKLHDVDQPFSTSDALEYWLDNVMNNVPEVAICYHKDGVTQGYQLIKTGDIPTMNNEAQFEPQVVQEYAGNVLHWLKENCTRDAGSYVLVREGGMTLKLYDLSTMYDDFEKEQEQEKETEESTALVVSGGNKVAATHPKKQMPFAYPVAMLCFRMGSKLANEPSKVISEKAIHLLRKALLLLPDDTFPLIRAQAHAHLATAHIRGRMGEQKAFAHQRGQQQCEEDEALCLAADELTVAVGILAGSKATKGESRAQDEQRFRERLAHLYLELARRRATNGFIQQAFEFVLKAEAAFSIEAKGAIPLALMPPPGTDLSLDAAAPTATGAAPADASTPAAPPHAVQVTARVLEMLGVVHEAIVLKLLREATPDLDELAAHLTDVVLPKATPESLLYKCLPVSSDVETNVNRALGFYYTALKHVSSLGNTEVVPSGVEVVYSTREDLKLKLGRMYDLWASSLVREERLSKASEQYLKAYACFSDRSGDTNRATTAINLGKLMGRLSAKDAGENPQTLSQNEEAFINKAIGYFQDAAQILKETTHSSLAHDAVTMRAHQELHLAKRIKHHFVALTESEPGTDYEKRAGDLLHSALNTYASLNNEAQVAETSAHLGQLYCVALRRAYTPPQGDRSLDAQKQRQVRRFKSSEMFFSRAAEYYSSEAAGVNHTMYLRLRREVVRLHLFQLSTISSTQQYLKTVIRTLGKVQPWLSNLKDKGDPETKAQLENELDHWRVLIRDVLAAAVKVYESRAVTPPKRALSKASAQRLNPVEEIKELHKAASAKPKGSARQMCANLIDAVTKLLLRE